MEKRRLSDDNSIAFASWNEHGRIVQWPVWINSSKTCSTVATDTVIIHYSIDILNTIKSNTAVARLRTATPPINARTWTSGYGRARRVARSHKGSARIRTLRGNLQYTVELYGNKICRRTLTGTCITPPSASGAARRVVHAQRAVFSRRSISTVCCGCWCWEITHVGACWQNVDFAYHAYLVEIQESLSSQYTLNFQKNCAHRGMLPTYF